MRKSDWELNSIDDRRKIVYIVDLNLGNVSVTNDAENVVQILNRRYPDYQIVYQDSTGDWDELVHSHGVFTGFAPWKEKLP